LGQVVIRRDEVRIILNCLLQHELGFGIPALGGKNIGHDIERLWCRRPIGPFLELAVGRREIAEAYRDANPWLF